MASKSEDMKSAWQSLYAITLIIGAGPFLMSDIGKAEIVGLGLLITGVLLAPIRSEGGQ